MSRNVRKSLLLMLALTAAACEQPSAPRTHQTFRPTPPDPVEAATPELPATPEPPAGSTLPLQDVEALQQILEALAEANQVPSSPATKPATDSEPLPIHFGDL